MMYLIGILISVGTGFLILRLLAGTRLSFPLLLCLGLGLGLGIDGSIAFYCHVLLNQFNRFIPIGLSVILLAVLLSVAVKKPKPLKPKKKSKASVPAPISAQEFVLSPDQSWGILLLCLLSIPLILTALYFPLGGWDAWSCWNLKAKFIFLGHEQWKQFLGPDFWRSNTTYPLLWPLINVWFWDLAGRFSQSTPMLNSILIALLTAGVLFYGLLELTGKLMSSLLAAVLVTALPLGVTFYISQYSDSLLGLYLLCAFVCLLLAEKYDLPKLKLLSMIFLGMLSFTKNEGLVACMIVASGILWQQFNRKKELKSLILTFFIALWPTLIFMLFIAPHNTTFVNGLTSSDKPITFNRVLTILIAPFLEMMSLQWYGLWILILGGVLLAGRKLWKSPLGLIGLSLLLYVSAVMGFYAVNTFYEIHWWISTTLSRILFALTPAVLLWVSLGLEI